MAISKKNVLGQYKILISLQYSLNNTASYSVEYINLIVKSTCVYMYLYESKLTLKARIDSRIDNR